MSGMTVILRKSGRGQNLMDYVGLCASCASTRWFSSSSKPMVKPGTSLQPAGRYPAFNGLSRISSSDPRFNALPRSLHVAYSSDTRVKLEVQQNTISDGFSTKPPHVSSTNDPGKGVTEPNDAQQLSDTDQSLGKVVPPIGRMLSGTMMALFIMPFILRRLHKYSEQSLMLGSSTNKDLAKYLIKFSERAAVAARVSAYFLQAWRSVFVHRCNTNFISKAVANQSALSDDKAMLSAFYNVLSLGLVTLGLAESCGLPGGMYGGVASDFSASIMFGGSDHFLWTHPKGYHSELPPLPPLPKHPNDLTQPSQEFSARTNPFHVRVKGKSDFKAAIDKDKYTCYNCLEMANIQKMYSELEPTLTVRGLLSPFSLRDKRSQGLHWSYSRLVGKVTYFTAYDFAKNFVSLPKESKRAFLDYLRDIHAIITPDWDTLGTSVTNTMYDHGLKYPNDQKLYKGECDASFNNVETKISVIIWKNNEVIWCEVLKDVLCDSSIEAEALAMCLLLKRSIEMSILSLEVCTDCDIVSRVMSGEQIYGKTEKLCNLYDLMRLMRGYFEEFMCRWVPRESLMFVDSLQRSEDEGITNSESLLCRWAPILNGAPIFSVKERTKSTLKNLVQKKNIKIENISLKTHCVCYLVVGDDNQAKINAHSHIVRVLKPLTVIVRVNDACSWLSRIADIGLKKIDEEDISLEECTICLQLVDEVVDKNQKARSSKILNIVVDVELLKGVHLDAKSVTIVFIAQNEIHLVENLDQFSAITFASFHETPRASSNTYGHAASNLPPGSSPGTPEVAVPADDQKANTAEPTSTGEGGSNGGAGGGALEFRRNNQQFQALQELIHTIPQIFQELSVLNPQFLRLIQKTHDDFPQLLNEPFVGGNAGLDQAEQDELPDAIGVTSEDQEAIGRLEAMGFDRARATRAFVACDRNEQLAVNYLLEHAAGEGQME